MKVAVYARVSKDEADRYGREQDPENQLRPLREEASRRGWEIVEFVERQSAKPGRNRPVFNELMKRVGAREFQGVFVWAFDRFTREGIFRTFWYRDFLQRAGAWFAALQEPGLTRAFSVEAAFMDELMLAFMAGMALGERERISERTKAGQARARAQGRFPGRPKKCRVCRHSHGPTRVCRRCAAEGGPCAGVVTAGYGELKQEAEAKVGP